MAVNNPPAGEREVTIFDLDPTEFMTAEELARWNDRQREAAELVLAEAARDRRCGNCNKGQWCVFGVFGVLVICLLVWMAVALEQKHHEEQAGGDGLSRFLRGTT